MICEGTSKHVMWGDDWTATTRDGGPTLTLTLNPNPNPNPDPNPNPNLYPNPDPNLNLNPNPHPNPTPNPNPHQVGGRRSSSTRCSSLRRASSPSPR
eukprot:scaffold63872_cov27-Phaeocystis_antarctica.AAC.1